jgi:hypothetical protein
MLSEDELKLLRSRAIQLWYNKKNLPDGGAMYGINFHRRRKGVHALGQEDWNYYGPDEDSAKNIKIYNVTIHDLANAPMPVPTLAHASGGIMHEPQGGVLRIGEMVEEEGFLSLRKPATYEGNVHSDAILAFYKFADEYWKTFVTQNPECGNPHIDVNVPPFSYDAPAMEGMDCTPNPHYLRRFEPDLNVLQKRFFPGIALSKDFYEFATTPGKTLSDLFATSTDIVEKRTNPYRLLCGDTQFHTSKGLFGLKMDFADGVEIKDLKIRNLKNTGDADNFLCSNVWSDYNGEIIGPNINKYAGADVHGLVVTKSFNVKMEDVCIDEIYSEEGHAFGVDLIGDRNGRSVGKPKPYKVELPNVAVRNVVVGMNIKGGDGDMVRSFETDPMYVDLEGLELLKPPNLNNKWNPPLAAMTMAITDDYYTPYNLSSAEEAYYEFRRLAPTLDDAFPYEVRTEAIEYLGDHYGIHLDVVDLSGYDLLDTIYVEDVGSLRLTSMPKNRRTYLESATFKDWALPAMDKTVHDIFFQFEPVDELLARGVWGGGPAGTELEEGAFIRIGVFIIVDYPIDEHDYPGLAGLSFESPDSPFVKKIPPPIPQEPMKGFENYKVNRIIRYYAEQPSSITRSVGTPWKYGESVESEHLVAVVFDELLGYGTCVGLFSATPTKAYGFLSLVFTDIHPNLRFPADGISGPNFVRIIERAAATGSTEFGPGAPLGGRRLSAVASTEGEAEGVDTAARGHALKVMRELFADEDDPEYVNDLVKDMPAFRKLKGGEDVDLFPRNSGNSTGGIYEGLTIISTADGHFYIEDPYPNDEAITSLVFRTQEADIKAFQRFLK